MTNLPAKAPSDRARAFKRYKQGVAEGGKPFFPYGVYHDIIAAIIVLIAIIMLSVVWYAQANCDSWFNVNCKNAATAVEQHQYTPDTPGSSIWETEDGDEITIKPGDEIPEGAEPVEGLKGPLLGVLYEEQADPATTQYHPRPEWYFYFLFYLLIVFSAPATVVLGTIIVPTIFLVLLLAWPFLDRKRERRPSRRPVAMAMMTVTAIALLAFTYEGSQSGKESGPEGITAEQQEMPGFDVVFNGSAEGLCTACHVLGGAGGAVGPNLDGAGKIAGHDTLDWQIRHLDKPTSEVPGSTMPPRGGAPLTDEEVAQVAAFMLTLGVPEKASDPVLKNAGQPEYDAAVGEK